MSWVVCFTHSFDSQTKEVPFTLPVWCTVSRCLAEIKEQFCRSCKKLNIISAWNRTVDRYRRYPEYKIISVLLKQVSLNFQFSRKIQNKSVPPIFIFRHFGTWTLHTWMTDLLIYLLTYSMMQDSLKSS